MTTYRILITIPEGSSLLEPDVIGAGLSKPKVRQAVLDLIESELDFGGVFDPAEGGNCTLELLPNGAQILRKLG